jgi:hypothetical protein
VFWSMRVSPFAAHHARTVVPGSGDRLPPYAANRPPRQGTRSLIAHDRAGKVAHEHQERAELPVTVWSLHAMVEAC